jgi:CheY-like chemotaxis protein
MMDRESFAELVHSALAHLYDHAYLQGHPLARPLVSAMPDERGRALRRLLLHAIQDLKPPLDAPPEAPGWRHYQYLYLRYVEAKPVAEIAGGLAVSERQTRRRHRNALDALARVLWDQWQALAGAEDDRGPGVPSPPTSRASSPLEVELRRIRAGADGAADAVEVIDRALGVVSRLADQRGVEVAFARPPTAAPVRGEQAILRQAVVGALVYAIQRAAERSIAISATPGPEWSAIAVRFRRPAPVTRAPPADGELDDVRRLLRTQQADLALRAEADALVVELILRTARPRRILVVDDNPDMCQLYRRFLRGSGYEVVEARSGDAALRLLDELSLSGIILDVMLPLRDGWDILQVLRGQSHARELPVLVCSVLQQRELALSLGATDFLAKPITQRALLEAMARCWGPESQARSGIPGRSGSAP